MWSGANNFDYKDSTANGPAYGGGAFLNLGGPAYMDYLDNPQNYTTNKPNQASKAAFSIGKSVGGIPSKGGPVKYANFYKIKKAKPAAVVAAKPAPKPVAAITNPSNTTPAGKKYQSQIAALTASIAAQKKQAVAAQAAAQETSQAKYQSQLSEMQSLYASNLQSTKNQFGLQIKGLQTGYGKQIAGLQSSVSGLQTTISDNAAAYQQNIADQAAQFKAEQQTMMTNQERARLAGATPQLRLQEAQDMKQAGTKTFKKRIGSQFNPTAYGSLAAIKSGTLNI